MTRQAELLATHSPDLFRAAVKRAAQLLREGEVVALPTETVYGLAADALNPQAVNRIFEIKGRPRHNPIIVHITGLEMARRCVVDWSPLADQLARAFWPGPLTLILPSARIIPESVRAGGPTVGIRWPSHPLIQAVIAECQSPLAAPSANLSNRVSPTTADHVLKQLGRRVPLVVDGGACNVGIESTVLDISVTPPRLLRPGMIHENALVAVTENLIVSSVPQGEILKSPGQLPRHYAPQTRLVIWSWSDETALLHRCLKSGIAPSRVNVIAHTRIPSGTGFGRVSVIPHDAQAFARAIYGELDASDEAGGDLIVVEAPPDSAEWQGIADRLKRAAG